MDSHVFECLEAMIVFNFPLCPFVRKCMNSHVLDIFSGPRDRKCMNSHFFDKIIDLCTKLRYFRIPPSANDFHNDSYKSH